MKFLSKERALTLSMLFGTALAVLIGSFSAFAGECADMPERLFRMHILANSDKIGRASCRERVLRLV